MGAIADSVGKRAGLIVLVASVGVAALMAMRGSNANRRPEGLIASASASAAASEPDAGGAVVSSDEMHETPVDPASREVARPPETPPPCAAPLTPREEKQRNGRIGRGCVREGDGGRPIKEGRWIVLETDGRLASGFYVNDVEEGLWTTWYPNGNRAAIISHEAGAPHGKQIEWLPTGQRFAERNFRHGTLDGTVTVTYADGTVLREEWLQGTRLSKSEGD